MRLASLRFYELNRFLICWLVYVPAHDSRSQLRILLCQLFADAVTCACNQHNVIGDIALFGASQMLEKCLEDVVKYFDEQEDEI